MAGSNVTILQPQSLRKEQDKILEDIKPQLVIVADYGQILDSKILNFPEHGCINVHASLLPKLRGAAPIKFALLENLKETGITLMKMDEGLDTGDIIVQGHFTIRNETASELTLKLSELGAGLLQQTLPLWLAGEIKPGKQDETKVTFAHKEMLLEPKYNDKLFFNSSYQQFSGKLKAYDLEGVWIEVTHNNQPKRLKIFTAGSMLEKKSSAEEPQFFRDSKKLFMQLQAFAVELIELQLSGMNKGPSANYLFLAPNV